MNIYTKTLNNILAKQVKEPNERIIHHDQVGFITGKLGSGITIKM